MKTVILIDGFNLYYGLLRGTHLKWLDLHSLFKGKILAEDVEILEIRYYTAPVRKGMSDDPESHERQQRYWNALSKTYPSLIHIIQGRIQKSTAIRRSSIDGDLVKVLEFEEKETDVRIACDALLACMNDEVEQIVLCSNDTDFSPLLDAIRMKFPRIRIGLVSPVGAEDRTVAGSLKSKAHWNKVIKGEYLEECQLPKSIPNSRIKIPLKWLQQTSSSN